MTGSTRNGRQARRWAVAGFAAVLMLGGGGYLVVAEHADARPIQAESRPAAPSAVSEPVLFEEPFDPNWPGAEPEGVAPGGTGKSDSTPLSRPPAIPEDEQRAGAAGTLALSGTAKQTFSLRKLPWAQRYVPTKVIKSFPNLTSAGICMDKRTNPPRPHPIAAAHCGEAMWNNYRLTNDRAWLIKAKNQARWLMNFKQVYSGAWFYPYLWDHTLAASPTMPAIRLKKPWYSAMAQGAALGLFVRLYETTKEKQYKTAADRTFNSLLVRSAPGKPWATWVHKNYLWLEEATFGNGTGDRIFNGHMFALFGVYDYWALTADRRARELSFAALTTTVVYASRLRRANWRSYYDDHRRGESNGYHYTHTSQLRYLAEITGDARFNLTALQLWRDHPMNVTASVMTLEKGAVQGYRLANGRPVLARTVTLTRPTLTVLAWRNRLAGSPEMWMRAGAGPLRGLYIRQQPRRAYVTKMADAYGMRVPVTRTTRAASLRYHTYDAATGKVTVAASTTPAKGARISIIKYAVIGGVPYFEVAAGTYQGKWVALSELNP